MFDNFISKVKKKIVDSLQEDTKEINNTNSSKQFIQNNIKKGKDYEKFVGQYFENKGYIVKFNGIEKGKKDNSIDLIAVKDKKIILIQCKNWKENGKYKIDEKMVKSFVGDTYSFVEHNNNYKNYEIKRLFVISGKILDKSAYFYIKNNQDIIRYLLLEYK